MPTLKELIKKAEEQTFNWEDPETYHVITKEAMLEFGKSCYMEGVNSGTPWGGSKVEHLENFLKTE